MPTPTIARGVCTTYCGQSPVTRSKTVLLLAVALVGSQAGGARASWSPPSALSAPSHLATYPEVGLDSRGDAVAVWMDATPTVNDRIMASARLGSTGAWRRPVALSPAADFGTFPELAVDASGATVAVWQQSGTSQGNTNLPFIEASFKRSPTSPWSRPVRISKRGVDSEGPEVAINSDGQAVAIWFTAARTSSAEVSTINIAHGVWSKPVVLQQTRKVILWPEITINQGGEAFAVWKRYIRHTGGRRIGQGDTQWEVGAAVKPAHRSSWLVRGDVGREEEFNLQGDHAQQQPGPQLAADATGGAIAVWQAGTSSHILTDFAVWKAKLRAWSKPATISQVSALWPQVAASPTGATTVVWEGNNFAIQSASGPISSCCWSAPRTLGSATPPQFAPYLSVVIDGSGDALASWTAGHPEIALRIGSTGSWQQAIGLTTSNGGDADAAMTSLGQAVAVWQQPNSQGSAIEEAATAPN